MSRAYRWFSGRMAEICSQWSFMEVSGCVGDLGTLLPFTIALAKQDKINVVPAFVFGGLFNITSAIHWNIPMPVQPMKAIATIAITTDYLNKNSVICAGILTASVVALLGLTGGIDLLHYLVPMPVVRGLQVGLGVKMIMAAVGMALDTGSWAGGFDCILTAILTTITMAIMNVNKKIPTALLAFLFGIIAAIVVIIQSKPPDGKFPNRGRGYFYLALIYPSSQDWWHGFVHGAISQIPLTTLNSVIALVKLSHDLFPNRTQDITRRNVAVGVGTMNIVGLTFGAFPMCHGAGGLAAQHAFGSRGGLSVLILGIGKIVVVLLLGENVMDLFEAFPDAILSPMLGLSGLGLAVSGVKGLLQPIIAAHQSDTQGIDRDDDMKPQTLTLFRRDCRICFATVAMTVATSNAAVGGLSGIITAWIESELVRRLAHCEPCSRIRNQNSDVEGSHVGEGKGPNQDTIGDDSGGLPRGSGIGSEVEDARNRQRSQSGEDDGVVITRGRSDSIVVVDGSMYQLKGL